MLTILITVPVDARAKTPPKRRSEVIGYLTKLEQGLFGERDLKSVERLLKGAKGVERSWLVMTLAQYQRSMLQEPVEGLKLLAPEVLSATYCKAWLKQLAAAEKKRRAAWFREKEQAVRDERDAPEGTAAAPKYDFWYYIVG